MALNRAVAAAMVDGPAAGLRLLEPLEDPLGDHHRLHAVRAHLLEMAGDKRAARLSERQEGRTPPPDLREAGEQGERRDQPPSV